MNRNQQQQQLLQAFDQFNDVSDSLSASFNRLNDTVSAFTERMDVAGTPVSAENAMNTHLRALLDAIPGSVIVINAQGRVVDFNVAAKELLAEPLLGELWRDVVNRVFQHELDQGELRTNDGRQFSISTRPLGYQPGQILLLSDVTQTRQLQRTAQQNLHLMTMGRMMASLAHQIRTPLSSSMLYLSQIVDGQLNEEKSQRFSRKALERIRHIESMINDMLVFAHGGQFHTSDFAISDLLNELRDQMNPQVQKHDVALVIDVNCDDVALHGNKDALLGAMANLCMNAIDARDSELEIHIEVALTSKGMISIDVSDNGRGMDEPTLAHLFDPFFTTKTDGTGLGLAVVKSVIESHQGSIEAASKPGAGSRFRILLPSLQASKSQLSGQNQEEKQYD